MNKNKQMSNQIPFESLFFSRTNEFLSVYLVRQAGRSENTKKSYKSGLSAFYDYVTIAKEIPATEFQFKQCTYNFLLEYSQYLQTVLKCKSSTVNSRMAAIRAYLEYVSDCDASVIPSYITVRKVPLLTVPKVQKPVLRSQELTVFLDSPNHNYYGNRDRFILILLFDSAIRVGELVKITLGDVICNGENYSILIHGKGRKERCIVLSRKTSQHMKAYLHAYHNGQTDPSRPLVYTKVRENLSPMSVRNVERIVNKYGALTSQTMPTMPDSVTPHTMRRSRATTLYQDGVPLEQVSALLGHSQIETTRTYYASPSLEQMREVVERGSSKEPEAAEWVGHTEDIKKKFGLG